MSEIQPASVLRDPVLNWTGTTCGLFKLFFRDLLLSIATLGVYRFWATTNMRQYVCSNIRVAGRPLTYTGTGWGLMRLSLLWLPVVLALAALAAHMWLSGSNTVPLPPPEYDMSVDPPFGAVGSVILSVVFTFMLLVCAFVIALLTYPLVHTYGFLQRRYLLAHTQLCDTGFGQDGSAAGFAGAMSGRMLLCLVTLGTHTPWMETERLRRTRGATRWGKLKFGFTGQGGELLGWHALTWMSAATTLAVVTAALSMIDIATRSAAGTPADVSFWAVLAAGSAYAAAPVLAWLILSTAVSHFTIRHLTLADGAIRFGLKASFGRLLVLRLTNALIVVFSLGLLTPLAVQRRMRFFMTQITLTGDLAILEKQIR